MIKSKTSTKICLHCICWSNCCFKNLTQIFLPRKSSKCYDSFSFLYIPSRTLTFLPSYLSSILVLARSSFSRIVGSWASSSQAVPQPRTRARSLPVPRGSTPIWHWLGQIKKGKLQTWLWRHRSNICPTRWRLCACMCRRNQTGNAACFIDVRVCMRIGFGLQDGDFHSKKVVFQYGLLLSTFLRYVNPGHQNQHHYFWLVVGQNQLNLLQV